MTNKEYEQHEGIRKSQLQEIKKSPLHFKWKMDHPQKDTPALLFGRAFHKFVLEEDTFFDEFAVAQVCDRRTKNGKQFYQKFELSSAGKDVISAVEFKKITEMKKSILSVSAAADLLNGDHEQSYFWTDGATGEACKCRPDIINHKKKTIVDLKTTDSCANGHFERSAKKYGYKLQAGMYCEGVFNNTFEEYGFKFLAIEKNEPYAVRVYNCTPEYINQGADEFHELISIYHNCKTKNKWDGYDSEEVKEVDLLADDFIE